MPPVWLSLIAESTPTLDNLLRRFIDLYDALKEIHEDQYWLKEKRKYQYWFEDWWTWWCLRGTGNGAYVSAYNARWFFNQHEREQMIQLLDAFIEDTRARKIRRVSDLPDPHNPGNACLPFDLDEQEKAYTRTQLAQLEENFETELQRWRRARSVKLNDRSKRIHGTRYKAERPVGSFKLPDISKCAQLKHEGASLGLLTTADKTDRFHRQKPLAPEYMPNETSPDPHSLAHPLFHNFSHRQRAIYRI